MPSHKGKRDSQHMVRLRANNKAKGLVERTYWVPANRAEEARAFCESLRAKHTSS